MAVTDLHVVDVNFLFRTILHCILRKSAAYLDGAFTNNITLRCLRAAAKISLEGARVALKQSDGYAMQIIRCRLVDRISQSNKMARR